MEIEVTTKVKKQVRYLKAECHVCCWGNTKINGVYDFEGGLIPCRKGKMWSPVIDLKTGRIEDWPPGTIASIHYEVWDDGKYTLLDADGDEVKTINKYVPTMMCQEDEDYGNYIIMDINADGTIQNWRVDLKDFEEND